MKDVEALVEGVTLLALRPGDKLAIRVPEAMDEDAILLMRDTLKQHWPDIDPAVFLGDFELFVLRAQS